MKLKRYTKVKLNGLFIWLVWFHLNAQASTLNSGSPVDLEEEIFVHLSDNVLISGEELWLHVTATYQRTLSPSRIAYAEILDREGNPVKQEMLELKNGRGEGYLTIPDNLISDNYLLRVYTRNSPKREWERGVFHRILTILNPQSPPNSVNDSSTNSSLEDFKPGGSPNIQIGKERFSKKEKVNITLLADPSATLQISVRQLSPLPAIPGLSPQSRDIYDPSEKEPVRIPEIYGHIVQGKSLASKIDTTEIFFLTAHGVDSHLFLTKPLANGDLFFETAAFKHFNYVIVQSSKSEEQVDFILESPYWSERPGAEFQIPELTLSESQKNHLLDRILAKSTKNYYYPSISAPIQRSPPLFTADYTFLLDDYNRFDDFATVLREYVPQVYVRSRNKKVIFRNINIPYQTLFRDGPLILVDGMPVFDSDALSRFNPKDIMKLEIINRNFYFHDEIFEGVISLTSFQNDFGKFDLPKNALFIEYPGIQVPKNPDFTPFQENTLESRLPDFRNILYWNTKTKTDDEGRTMFDFYTSELEGFYEINVSYWSEKNGWTAYQKIIEVR